MDEGGLTLVEVGRAAYWEIGGIPDALERRVPARCHIAMKESWQELSEDEVPLPEHYGVPLTKEQIEASVREWLVRHPSEVHCSWMQTAGR